MQDNKPSEAGLYWARTSISKKWDHIIRIKGEFPFLNYVGWSLKYPLHKATTDNGLIGVNPTKFMFENKIKCDYDYSNNWKYKQSLSEMLTALQEVTKETIPQEECLYWVISKSEGDVLLAYITGEPPYMSCFTWNIYSNLRKQVTDANDLTYLTKVEKSGIITCSGTNTVTGPNVVT